MKLFNGQVQTIGDNLWHMKFQKPFYGTVVAIRDKILLEAIKKKKFLLVECENGQEVVDPKTWIKEGKRIEKVFKIPERPMVLYERAIKLGEVKPVEAFMRF